VPSNDLQDHLAFVERLLYPQPGDQRRIVELRNILERMHSRSHYLLPAGRARRIPTANPGPLQIRHPAPGRRHRNRFRCRGPSVGGLSGKRNSPLPSENKEGFRCEAESIRRDTLLLWGFRQWLKSIDVAISPRQRNICVEQFCITVKPDQAQPMFCLSLSLRIVTTPPCEIDCQISMASIKARS
jgi:hypothetical protein